MNQDDQAIEQEIVAKGKTAPRVTPGDIEANIWQEFYFSAAEGVQGATSIPAAATAQSLGLLTFCVLVLQNGFTVTGESACASPENFDAEIGRKIARDNAINKVWPLMGYQLRDELHRRAVFDSEPKTSGQLTATDPNPHYEGQFDGETPEQAAARRAAARRPNPGDGAPKPSGHNPVG
ncbi:Gp49 family protein [Massilia varians]|uniref:Gp49 family protein n=1 Tax=Massilia varians TaxID=457921 RepID=UPI0027D96046|nr:Gp49 family protein [Massilia varians]